MRISLHLLCDFVFIVVAIGAFVTAHRLGAPRCKFGARARGFIRARHLVGGYDKWQVFVHLTQGCRNANASRKLDFLSQEFGREASTLCAKAGDAGLSRIGLELRTVVDQMREQVQNVE